MGKIITGQELINIFKGCCSGQAQSFTDAAYIDGIQESMGLSNVENSGRCPAFNGNIDTTFDPTMFWNQMYGGETGYEFYGDYQLEWTSGYLGLVDTQLVDSTYVPNFQSQMLCTNLKYNGDFNFGVYTDGDYYGQFDITVYIKFGGTMYTVARYRTSLSSGESESLGSDDISDIVFAGSSNIPNNSSTYTYEVVVGWETYDDSDGNSVYNINGLGCDVYSEGGLLSGGIIGYSASAGGGGSFTYKGQATFSDITSISGVEIIGEWESEGGGGSTTPDRYTTIRITNSFIKTNSTSVVYVSGATSASTISQPNVYLYSVNLTQLPTQVYLVNEDIANGEIGVQFPAQYIGSTSGNFLLPLSLSRNNYNYKLYIPITVLPDGTVNMRGSGECYLDLASVSYYTAVSQRPVWNNSSTQVTFRPLISSGVPSKSMSGGSNGNFTPLLSTTHVYPSSSGVNVNVGFNTTPTTTSTNSRRVATNISNTTVNLIPYDFANGGLYNLLQCIGKNKDHFTVYFERVVS